MQRFGYDIARMDTNWPRLYCGMTTEQADSVVGLGFDTHLLAAQSKLAVVELNFGARQLVFIGDKLVSAKGPTTIGLSSDDLTSAVAPSTAVSSPSQSLPTSPPQSNETAVISFEKSKMYVVQKQKVRLQKVLMTFQGDALVVAGATDDYISDVRIPYSAITEIKYERSKHRRWKTGVIFAPRLFSKQKKYWLAVMQGEEETVFQLDKSNFLDILSVIEEKTGKKIKVVVGEN